MKKPVFKGIGTALVTPMTEKGVDYPALERLVEYQLEGGVDALIAAATTGEGPTLSLEEHVEVIRFIVEKTRGRVPVVAGTGSNDTAYAVELSRTARDVGADALLAVTPYYNKCTQKGIIESFYAVADSTELPVIVYNVPSRTGVNILPETYAELAKHDRIVGIKEANGDIASVVKTVSLCGGDLALYSGNDDQIVPLMAMGGIGCISVLSNILPGKTREICTRFFEGDVSGAAKLQCELLPLINALFSEVNPIPVKAALQAMGMIDGYIRLPLTPMEEPHRQKLLALMRAEGLNV